MRSVAPVKTGAQRRLPQAPAFAGATVGEEVSFFIPSVSSAISRRPDYLRRPIFSVAPVRTGAQRRLPQAPAFAGATVGRECRDSAFTRFK